MICVGATSTCAPIFYLMTLALGIDPGTATTGYGLVRITRDGNLEAVTFGVILTPAHTPAQERLLTLYRELKKLICSPPS